MLQAQFDIDFERGRLNISARLKTRQEADALVASLHLAKRALWPRPKPVALIHPIPVARRPSITGGI